MLVVASAARPDELGGTAFALFGVPPYMSCVLQIILTVSVAGLVQPIVSCHWQPAQRTMHRGVIVANAGI